MVPRRSLCPYRGSGSYLGDGHGALLQHQARDSQIGYPARHPRAARHRTSGTLGRLGPALCSIGTARSRGGTTRCAHLRHIRGRFDALPAGFPGRCPGDGPAGGPADLLAGAHPGAASPATGSPDRDGGHRYGQTRLATPAISPARRTIRLEWHVLVTEELLWIGAFLAPGRISVRPGMTPRARRPRGPPGRGLRTPAAGRNR
jgi:hypothetical protein